MKQQERATILLSLKLLSGKMHLAASQIFPIFSFKREKKIIRPGITDPFLIERHPSAFNYYNLVHLTRKVRQDG